MTIKNEVSKTARDQALQNTPKRALCKVMSFHPDNPGGPAVVCVPYSRLKDTRPGFENDELFFANYARKLWVHFPTGQSFFIDPDMYDVYADFPFEYSREGYPVMKPDVRQRDYRVADGWTAEEVKNQNINPSNIRMRIQDARGKIHSKRACFPDEPRYPQRDDIWFGPLRQRLDSLHAELWGAPKKLLAKFDRTRTDIMTELPSFPLADGTGVLWKGKREHPLQQWLGSSAALPYRRFIWSLIDPGYIVGVARALRDYFEALDDQVYPGYVTTRHERVNLGEEVRED